MPSPLEIATALLAGLPLWIAGVHFFDLVHWVLHHMMRSSSRVLRSLSAPHRMHHLWLDTQLRVRWENQVRNIWGHIVLEYVTQLGFSGLLLLVLPVGPVAACVVYQTLLFAYILSERGLDINHRPIEMLDAYRPSFLALPAYHALHHAHPDAYFSAYTKLVDYLVGGGAQLRGKRVALSGADHPLGQAFRAALEREGVAQIRALDEPCEPALAETDVLVLCDPSASPIAHAEALARATRERQIPPELWAVHESPEDATARHYYRDVRLNYRAILIPDAALRDPEAATRAARIALFFIRRGFNYVPASLTPAALGGFRRFRRTKPQRPDGVPTVRHRAELLQTV